MIHSSVYKRLPSPNEIMYCSLNHEVVRAAPSADPEGGGGRGSGPPLENHKLYALGFYRE